MTDIDASPFLRELRSFQEEALAPLVQAGQAALAGPPSPPSLGAQPTALLQVALANELNVSELAAFWMPTTGETDVKLAFAKQAGDEASHFELVAGRLAELGVDASTFQAPKAHPLFDYLRSLSTTVERIAAGLFSLEALAYGVNENFIALCEGHGDVHTAQIYREYIQPDEASHKRLGERLLAKYAKSAAEQAAARAVVAKVYEIAAATRDLASQKLGTACLPGC